MPEIESKFEVDTDAETAWDHLTDMENFSSHLPGFEEYEEIDETVSHWTVSISLPMYSKTITFEVEVLQEELPRAEFELVPMDEPAEGQGSVEFKSVERDQTEITFGIEAEATGRMSPVLNKVIDRSLPKVTEGFITNVQESPRIGTPGKDENEEEAQSAQ